MAAVIEEPEIFLEDLRSDTPTVNAKRLKSDTPVIDLSALKPDPKPMGMMRSHKTIGEQTPQERIALAPFSKKAEIFFTEDLPNLGKTFGARIGGGILQGLGGTRQAIGEGAAAGGEPWPGVDPVESAKGGAEMAAAGQQMAAEGRQIVKLADEEKPLATRAGRIVGSAVESIGQQVPAIGVGAVTGSPTIALGMMGAQTFGQTYSEARANGQSMEDATKNALIQGGTEVATETLPFLKLAKFMKPGKLSRKVGEYLLAEVPGEHIATAVQNTTGKYFDEKDPAKRARAAVDYFFSKEHTQDQIDTFFTTLVQGAVMTGTAAGVHKIGGQKEDPLTQVPPQEQPVNPITPDAVLPPGPPPGAPAPLALDAPQGPLTPSRQELAERKLAEARGPLSRAAVTIPVTPGGTAIPDGSELLGLPAPTTQVSLNGTTASQPQVSPATQQPAEATPFAPIGHENAWEFTNPTGEQLVWGTADGEKYGYYHPERVRRGEVRVKGQSQAAGAELQANREVMPSEKGQEEGWREGLLNPAVDGIGTPDVVSPQAEVRSAGIPTDLDNSLTKPTPQATPEAVKVGDVIPMAPETSTVANDLQAEKKEPWQMTRDEFLGIGTVGRSPYEEMIGAKDDRRWREQDRTQGAAVHKWGIVDAALKEGKPVPAEVLADYPELQGKKTAEEPQTPTQPEAKPDRLRRIVEGKSTREVIAYLKKNPGTEQAFRDAGIIPEKATPLKAGQMVVQWAKGQEVAPVSAPVIPIAKGKQGVAAQGEAKQAAAVSKQPKAEPPKVEVQPAKAETPDPRQAWEAAQDAVEQLTSSIKEGEKAVKSNMAQHIVMNARSRSNGKTTMLSAPYDGTKEGALKTAKTLRLYASENFDASMQQSETFATDKSGQPMYAFTQGEGVTEIHEVKGQAKLEAPDAPLEDYSLDTHDAFVKRLYDGDVSPAEIRQHFDALSQAKAAITETLNGKTKTDLLNMLGGLSYRYKNDKKSAIANAVYDSLLMDFVLDGGLAYDPFSKGGREAALRKKIDAYTTEDTQKYADKVKEARAQRQERLESHRKALQNPETLEEFRTFIAAKGEAELSSEQRAKYDELVAQANREKKTAEVEQKATVKQVAVETGMKLVETEHTRDHYPLFVVQLEDRVERDTYNELVAAAKKLGGWYSSFKGNGAVPGFQFKEKQAAEKFMALREGDVSRADEIQERKEEKKQTATERLKDAADALEQKATEKLNADRMVNTARRARMADSAESDARKDIALAKTMRNLAEAMAQGSVTHLDGVRAKTHIETLNAILNRAVSEVEKGKQQPDWRRPPTVEDVEHVQYPHPYLHRSDMTDLANMLYKVKGAARLALKIKKIGEALGKHENGTYVRNASLLEDIREGIKKARAAGKTDYILQSMDDRFDHYDRVKRMGLDNLPILRAALREFIQFKDEGPKKSRLKELERSLATQNVGIDFFPTPKPVARQMAEELDVQPGMTVLEPSAGKGNLADAVKEIQPDAQIDVAEISPTLRAILEEKGYNVVEHDFTDLPDTAKYDRIIMNPPFSSGQDADHIMKAYDLLKPGGKLIAISGEGIFFRGDKKATAFREWLDEVSGESEKLPEGTFTDKSEVKTTGVNSRLIRVEKPADNATSFPARKLKEQRGSFSTKPLTETAAFAKWFGNSKVVDENGKPLVVYHGTEHDFDQFDTRKSRASIETGQSLGSWFASTGEAASRFTNVRFAGNAPVVIPSYLSIQNPYVVKSYADLQKAAMNYKSKFKGLRQVLDREGYDGIEISESTTDGGGTRRDFVAFSPTQIKSATGNNGNFDPADPNILHDITSVVPLALKELARIGKAGKEALPHLIEIGKALYAKGATNYKDFVQGMKRELGNLWEKFKGYGLKVWRDVNKIMKDETGAITVWHGTPHDFDQFSLQHIGTGEGAQAYGWGLYFTGKKKVAQYYRDMLRDKTGLKLNGKLVDQSDIYQYTAAEILMRNKELVGPKDAHEMAIESVREIGTKGTADTRKKAAKVLSILESLKNPTVAYASKGNLYEAELAPEEEDFLDWDKPLSKQSEKVRNILMSNIAAAQPIKGMPGSNRNIERTGEQIYGVISSRKGWTKEKASKYLLSIGIPGIRYFDGVSRNKGEGSHNYVIFDDSLAKVQAKNGITDFAKKMMKDERGLFAPFGGDIGTKGQFSDLTDRKAKVEIDDSGAKLKEGWRDAETLGDALDHPALYEAFPAARDIQLRAFEVDPNEEENGKYVAKDNAIFAIAPTEKELLNVALHEIQHAIQEQSGFAKGGSPSQAMDESLRQQAKQMFREAESLRQAGRIEEANALSNKAYRLQDASTGFDAYQRLAGEEEARRTASRSDMTAAERMGRPYDRTDIENRDDLIVRMEGGVSEYRQHLDSLREGVTGRIRQIQKSPKVAGFVASIFKSDKNLSVWMKTVGTMYHTAEMLAKKGKYHFKAVFEKGQDYLGDVSAFAVAAEQEAPTLFRKTSTVMDALKSLHPKEVLSPQYRADLKAIAAPLYEGTLWGGADPTKGKVWSDETLRKNYGLTDQQIAMYREALAAANQSLEDLSKSIIAKNAEAVQMAYDRTLSLQEMADDVLSQIEERKSDMEAMLEDAKEAYKEDLKAFVETVKDAPDKARQLKKFRDKHESFLKAQEAGIETLDGAKRSIEDVVNKSRTLMEHGYFPLMRFGRFTVTVRDAQGEVLYFGMHQSETRSKIEAETLKKEFPEASITTGTMSQEAYKLFDGMSADAVQLFAEHLDKEESAAYQEYIKKTMNNRSSMKRLMHRKGTEGYSQDVLRTLASFITSNARRTSGNYHLGQMLKLVNAITDKSNPTYEQDGDIQDFAVKLYNYLKDPTEEASSIRAFLFFQYIGGSISSAAANLTQPMLMTAPYLTQYTDAKNVLAKMTRAAKLAADDPSKVKGEIGKALRRAEKEGITAPQEIYQLTAIASNRLFAAHPGWNSALKAWGGLFSMAELVNRRQTFIAAYEIAKENGKTDAEAYNFANDAIKATQGVYNRGNRPRWSRGAIGATLMTFKQFVIMFLELYKRLPMKQRGIMIGLLWLAVGAEGLPFYEDMADVFDTLGQWAGYATNSKRWVRDKTREYLGDFASKTVLNGINAWMPFDLQTRIGFGNLIPGTGAFKPSSLGNVRDAKEAAGALGAFIFAIVDALELTFAGRPWRAIKEISPRTAQGVATGTEMAITGKSTDKYGRKIADASPGDALMKFLVLNPKHTAEESEIKRSLMQDKDLLRKRREKFLNMIVDGYVEKDQELVMEGRKAIAEWNTKNPELRIELRRQDIQRRIEAARASSRERFLKGLGKAQRRQAMQELAGQ